MVTQNFASDFTRGAVEVLETYLENPAYVATGTEESGGDDLEEVAVIIGITGRVEGRMILEMGMKTALRLCEALNWGEPFAAFNEMARATLSELANLVSGRAVTYLNDKGTLVSITPPVIFCGKGMKACSYLTPFVVPIETDCGQLKVNVAVQENDDD